jgi:hypothetical protein
MIRISIGDEFGDHGFHLFCVLDVFEYLVAIAVPWLVPQQFFTLRDLAFTLAA